MFMASANVPVGSVIEPTIVHITMDAKGHVEEFEALQDGPAADKAAALFRDRKYAPIPQPAGASARLREAFVNVQFRPESSVANR